MSNLNPIVWNLIFTILQKGKNVFDQVPRRKKASIGDLFLFEEAKIMDMVKTTATFHSIYVIMTITIHGKSFLAPHILPGKDAI